MARLFEIDDPSACPSPLPLRPGEVARVAVSGGRVVSGGAAVEVLGPFVPAILGAGGALLTPMGPPGAILLVARSPVPAEVEVFAGDPFRALWLHRIRLVVAD